MPWIAEQNGDIVTPQNVDSSEEIRCRFCNNELHIRDSHLRNNVFVAKHFVHSTSNNCGGESEKHQKMKSITVSKIKHLFSDSIEKIETEKAIGQDRIADIIVHFSEDINSINNDSKFCGMIGDKLAIEVQYKNENKNIRDTTVDYLNQDYSVLWLWEEQFSNSDVKLLNQPSNKAGLIPLYSSIELTNESQVKNDIKESFMKSKSPLYKNLDRFYSYDSKSFIHIFLDSLNNSDKYINYIEKEIDYERICGNCKYSKNDDYRDGDNKLICWKYNPENGVPRKTHTKDYFAVECSKFVPESTEIIDDIINNSNIHPKLIKWVFNAKYRGFDNQSFNPDKDIIEFSLRMAYYMTLGRLEFMGCFNKQMSKALLRFHNIDISELKEKYHQTNYNEDTMNEDSLSEFI